MLYGYYFCVVDARQPPGPPRPDTRRVRPEVAGELVNSSARHVHVSVHVHVRLPPRAQRRATVLASQCVPLDAHSGTAGYTSSTGHGSNVRSMKRNAEAAAICRVRSNPVYSFAVGKSGARWKKMTSRPK